MSADASGRLRVQLLGPLRTWRDAAEISLGSPRRRAIFAVLAMRAGRSISREELISAVWGDTRPASVEGNLHTYISGLRRALDPDRATRSSASPLISDATGYAARIAPGDLDVTVFEQACAEAARSEAAGDYRAVAETLNAALGLWRGEALSGVPGPFAEAERDRLAALRVGAVERRAGALLELGGHRELVAELAGLVQEHPINESLRELLMLALYRCGRHAESLQVFRDARRVLIDELGVEPGAPLRRLHEQVLAFDPALTPLERPAPARAARPQPRRRMRPAGADALVGRSAELDRLRELVADVAGGRGRAVWVEGEAGSGKTELLTVALASEPGCQLRWGTAQPLTSRFPLRVLENSLGIQPCPVAAPAPRDEAGDWSWRRPDPLRAAADRVITRVFELFTESALVLGVVGMQWGVELSRRVWSRLLPLTLEWPLLLIATTRPDPDLDDLRDAANVVLPLEPLDPPDATILAKSLLGADPAPDLDELFTRAGGNPLYIREIARELVAGHALRRTGDLAELDPDARFTAPAALPDAVAGRLDTLAPTTRTVLTRAALLGLEFSVAEVTAVLGGNVVDPAPALAEAVAAGILAKDGNRLRFRHPTLHQVCYQRQRGVNRKPPHLRTAKALADAGGDPMRVAEQLAAAPPVSAPWLTAWLAVEHAPLIAQAPKIAADLLECAITHGLPDDPRREVLMTAMGGVLFQLERSPGALTADAGEADRTEAPEIWRFRHRVLLADLADGARAADHRYLAAYGWQTLWLVCSVSRDHERALLYLDRALAAAGDRADLATLRLDLLDNRMFTLQNLDRMAEAGRTLATARQLAADHDLLVEPRPAAVAYRYWTGHWDGLADAIQSAECTHALRVPGAAIAHRNGVATIISVRRDQPEAAAAHLAQAEQHSASVSTTWFGKDFLLAARSFVAERSGDPDGALEALRPLLAPSSARITVRHQWLPRFVRLAMAAGKVELAEEAAAVCAAEAAKELRPARALAAAEWCRGLIERDYVRVLHAGAHYAKVGRRVELASVLADTAVLLGEAGEHDQAAGALAGAVTIYTELGARWDQRQAMDRLARLGISLDDLDAARHPAGREPLSPAEVRLATLVAAEHADSQAGQVPPRHNIQTHVASVLSKLERPARPETTGDVAADLYRSAQDG